MVSTSGDEGGVWDGGEKADLLLSLPGQRASLVVSLMLNEERRPAAGGEVRGTGVGRDGKATESRRRDGGRSKD